MPGEPDGKESAYNSGDRGLTPGLGGSPGEGNDNPLQYSCLENSLDRGAWQALVHGGREELDTTEQLTLNYPTPTEGKEAGKWQGELDPPG